MKINSEESAVKAYVSIVLNNSVKINGIKLVSLENGKLIVVLPENSEKKIQYVVPVDNYFRQYIDKTLVDRYLKLKAALNK